MCPFLLTLSDISSETRIFNFNGIQFITLSVRVINLCQLQGHEDILLFSFKIFYHLIFTYLIDSEIEFVYAVRQVSGIIFPYRYPREYIPSLLQNNVTFVISLH